MDIPHGEPVISPLTSESGVPCSIPRGTIQPPRTMAVVTASLVLIFSSLALCFWYPTTEMFDSVYPETITSSFTVPGKWVNTSIIPVECALRNTYAPTSLSLSIQAYIDDSGNTIQYGLVGTYKTDTSYRAYLLGRAHPNVDYSGEPGFTRIQQLMWDLTSSYCTARTVGPDPAYITFRNDHNTTYYWDYPIRCSLNEHIPFPNATSNNGDIYVKVAGSDRNALQFYIMLCDPNDSSVCLEMAQFPSNPAYDADMDYSVFRIFHVVVVRLCDGVSMCWLPDLTLCS